MGQQVSQIQQSKGQVCEYIVQCFPFLFKHDQQQGLQNQDGGYTSVKHSTNMFADEQKNNDREGDEEDPDFQDWYGYSKKQQAQQQQQYSGKELQNMTNMQSQQQQYQQNQNNIPKQTEILIGNIDEDKIGASKQKQKEQDVEDMFNEYDFSNKNLQFNSVVRPLQQQNQNKFKIDQMNQGDAAVNNNWLADDDIQI